MYSILGGYQVIARLRKIIDFVNPILASNESTERLSGEDKVFV